MIDKTFQLIKGIGPVTERKLWACGIKCWDDILDSTRPKGIS
ncbi:MAG: exonuclease, partial [Candidatus Lokiarchaeota archaeon]|nr:exonuclease [Candidatus Lokiarchaeota archaeon]